MLLVLTSPDVVAPNGTPYSELVQILIELANKGNPVGAVSNHAQPSWFHQQFGASSVAFLQQIARQDGKIVEHNAKHFSLRPCDTLVLGGQREDLAMAKNGHAVVVVAGWAANDYLSSVGIHVATASAFRRVVELTESWPGLWWFEGNGKQYTVRALSDLSGYNKEAAQQLFAQQLTATLKAGDHRLAALLVVAAKSLLVSGFSTMQQLVWGVYPSSSSSNNDTEVLSDFCHRLRTTVSTVQFAKRGEPLFVRHRRSTKRSTWRSGSLDRTDPAEQLETVHLNPFYRGKLKGRTAIVLDDCTTYGVSFGVAAALLRKAEAAAVAGVALGKFGSQLRYYEIDLTTDPFCPVLPGQYRVSISGQIAGNNNMLAQHSLRSLIT